MREDAGPGTSIHRGELGEDVVELGEGVDDNKNIRQFEMFGIPEEHPGSDTEVSQSVIRDEFDDFIEFLFLDGIAGVEFPEFVEPGELEELLGEEEAC